MEYLVRRLDEETGSSFLVYSRDGLEKNEAIEWANFLDGINEVWERSDDFEETIIYISSMGVI